jgi:polyisoprenoid-binding protein YceI
MNRSIVGGLLCLVLLGGCDKKPEMPAETTAQASASAVMIPTAAPTVPPPSGAAATGMKSLMVKEGHATFLIDAPLEKIKGKAAESKGSLRLDPANLAASTGEVSFRLTTLETNTFGDPKKDASQTEHARTWMQVDPKAAEADRTNFEWATFTVRSLDVMPAKLADAPEKDGVRVLKGKAKGDLKLHGVTTPREIAFTAKVKGPVDAPDEVILASDAPFDLSLKQHAIMPRDATGSFLQGALEKIGKKIDDRIQVSLEVSFRK